MNDEQILKFLADLAENRGENVPSEDELHAAQSKSDDDPCPGCGQVHDNEGFEKAIAKARATLVELGYPVERMTNTGMLIGTGAQKAVEGVLDNLLELQGTMLRKDVEDGDMLCYMTGIYEQGDPYQLITGWVSPKMSLLMQRLCATVVNNPSKIELIEALLDPLDNGGLASEDDGDASL